MSLDKLYILVNDDIEISKGKLAGQVGHAVNELIYDCFKNDTHIFYIIDDYMENGQKKIILKCPQRKLEELEVEGYIAIRDLGLTDLEPNTLTCVNLGIFDEENVPRFVKRLRLL